MSDSDRLFISGLNARAEKIRHGDRQFGSGRFYRFDFDCGGFVIKGFGTSEG